jgi:hypothetical protein
MFRTLVSTSKAAQLKTSAKPTASLEGFAAIDESIAALELFGWGKTKAQRAEEKLKKAHAKFIDDMNRELKYVVHNHDRLYKELVEYTKLFGAVENIIKHKKLNEEKFKELVDQQGWIILWKDGKECLRNLIPYTQLIKQEVALISSVTDENAKHFREQLARIIDQMRLIDSIYEDAMYEDEYKGTTVKYVDAGYEHNFVETFVSEKEMILSNLQDLLKILRDLQQVGKTIISHASTFKDENTFKVLYRGYNAILGSALEQHPNAVMHFLMIYALHITKSCYE